MRYVALTLLGLAVATPAMARERTGYQAIVAGDFASATRQIEAERRIFPDRPELMLNLAAAYLKSGRTSDARGLYAQVLAQPAVAMDLPSGAVSSSHDIAERGIARLPQAFATR